MTDLPISGSHSLIDSRKIFERTQYVASDEDIGDLSRNMMLLEQRGLAKLNQRLIDCPSSFWDTLVEHNFAVSMVSVLDSSDSICYEPTVGLQRPPDFKITRNGITYWVQIKNLSKLEKENRQEKIFKEIERRISAIKISKFLGCDLAEDFSESDIPALIAFISKVAKMAREGQEFLFGNKAKLEFWLPQRSSLSHLSLGVSGDIDMVDQTGLAEEQVKQSIRNATRAFDWSADEKTINLIAMGSDSQNDIDICDALFGTEFEAFSDGHQSWGRKPGGMFEEHPFNQRLVGVIVLKRKDKKRPLSKYRMLFFLNESFMKCTENITSLFSFDQIVRYNMRPPMGTVNFGYPADRRKGEEARSAE